MDFVNFFFGVILQVNNAGIVVPAGIETLTMEQFDKTFDVNVRAPLQLTHLLRPHLIKTKGQLKNGSDISIIESFSKVN